MPTRSGAHTLYLVVSAGIILLGVIFGLVGQGQIHLLLDIADNEGIHFLALKTFTYQSNLLLVVGFLAIAALKNTFARYFVPYISVAIMLATSVTGLMYNFALVPIGGAPLPFSNFENFSTHVLVTLLALGNYFIFEEKGRLKWRHILFGMVFPAVYWAVIVTFGERINFSPYFFMNPNAIGWFAVTVWFLAAAAAFAGLGWLLIWFDSSRELHIPKAK